MQNMLKRLMLCGREGCCGVRGRLLDGVITRRQLIRPRQDWLSRTLPTGHTARNMSGSVGVLKEGRVSGATCRARRSVICCLALSERLGETLHVGSPRREVIAADANS